MIGEQPAGRHYRVLVVDNDLDALYYVDDLLQELGCRPYKVLSLDDAAAVLHAMRVDALVIRLSLVCDAAAQTIEQINGLHPARPVLFMTEARLEPDGDSSSLRCFMPHPPDLNELSAALAECLGVPLVRSSR
jgi:CheY-like chemotaxis protein